LLVAIAIIGVFATLAVQSTMHYLAAAKTAEAKHSVGTIGNAVVAASQRMLVHDLTPKSHTPKSKGKGAKVYDGVQGLCNDAVPVPASMNKVKGTKYQSRTLQGSDYQTGDDVEGWKCLRFEITQPQYFQYNYELGGPPISVVLPGGGSPKGAAGSANRPWSAYARGDLDGDGVHSWFILNGTATSGEVSRATAIIEDNPGE
jgi:type IV pilus assembly protein PilA